MASAPPIAVGHRFRDVSERTFGRPGLEWVVLDCLTLTDGMNYARLVCATDSSRQKTLSFAVLAERSRFLRVNP
jgi:hypothetical protein